TTGISGQPSCVECFSSSENVVTLKKRGTGIPAFFASFRSEYLLFAILIAFESDIATFVPISENSFFNRAITGSSAVFCGRITSTASFLQTVKRSDLYASWEGGEIV